MKIKKHEEIDTALEINKNLRAALSHDFLSPRDDNDELGPVEEKNNKLAEWKECLELQHFVLTEMSSIIELISILNQDESLKYDKQTIINSSAHKLAKVDGIVNEYSRLAHQEKLQTNKRNPREFYSRLANRILNVFEEKNYTPTLKSQALLLSCSYELSRLKDKIQSYSATSEQELFFRKELVDYLGLLSNLLIAVNDYYKNNLLLGSGEVEHSVLTLLQAGRN